MPSHPFYTNFTAGTVSEKLDARVDFAKYQNAARILKNAVVLPQGGVASRAGTIFLGRAKFNSSRIRLVPFQFSADQSYMVEFGVGYARFWTNRAQVVDASDVPVEVETPYSEDDLRSLRFEQSADVMYIGHPDHPPAKITRVTTTEFRYAAIRFFPEATYEPQLAGGVQVTLGQVSTGETTATAASAVFLAGDVGRQIRHGAGRAVITAFTSTTLVTVRVLDAFDDASLPADEWTLDGSANAGTLTPSADAPRWKAITLTSSLGAFRTTDVGKVVYLHDGMVRITAYTSTTVVSGQILTALTATTAAAAGAWTVESPSWSASLGYPGVPCLFQQRLWWAGSTSFPDQVWGSKTSDYENHGRGALDNEAIVYTLATTGVNRIRWMKPSSTRGLAIGTLASELTLDGGTEEPLTPSNVQMTERTRYGSDDVVDAMKVDNAQLFVQRGGTRLREMAYKFTDDDFASPDISILAEHLFRDRIVEMAYCATPESLVMVLLETGILNICTYEREQGIVAWTYAETYDADTFESVAALPNACGDGDEVWVASNREVIGGDYWATDYWGGDYWEGDYWSEDAVFDARYVEVFDGQLNTDSGLVWSGTSTNTFTGLEHLEGRTVRAVTAAGIEYDLDVTDGRVVLPDGVATTSIEVGLPWVMTVVTVRPELAAANGTVQGRRKHWNMVTVRVYATLGRVHLNSEIMDYPEGNDDTEPFSGDMRAKTNFGWDRDGFITIQRSEAKPVTITGITGSLQVADD